MVLSDGRNNLEEFHVLQKAKVTVWVETLLLRKYLPRNDGCHITNTEKLYLSSVVNKIIALVRRDFYLL